MKTNQALTNRSHPDGGQYALRREANFWEVSRVNAFEAGLARVDERTRN